MDLIPTIEENTQVDFSEESDIEIEYQPTKLPKEKRNDFNRNFAFTSSGKDPTSNVERKTKKKVDKRESSAKDTEDIVDDFIPADDFLKHDVLRARMKKARKKNDKTDAANETHQMENDDFENNMSNNLPSSFHQMNLSRPLMKAIGALGYTYPTPIQASTIPIALLGKDIYGCAATGTGKTAAFMLPTIERLLYKPLNNKAVTRVLVLVPTRELGVQVYQVTKQLCEFTSIDVGLAIGGLDVKAQETVLRQNPDIVIATPGRLIDHIKNTLSFSLSSIEVLILDEADRMLDEYFAEQMKEIINSCSKTRQTMLFSATMSEAIEDLAAVSLEKPVKIFMNNNQTVAFNLRQEFIRIREDKENDREPILASLICRIFHENCMVFVQTKKQAHRLLIILKLLGIRVGEIHGNLSQQQRLESLKKFKDNEIDVLVATDVAARGLDIVGVKTVINYVMPLSTEHYIHRVGRTARAGRAGVSVSLAGERERKIVKEIIKNTKSTVKNRIIPCKVIEKFRLMLAAIEPKIEEILDEERAEKEFQKTQQQLSKAEKKLSNVQTEKRGWFQTKKQRESEKQILSSKFMASNNGEGNQKVSKETEKSIKGRMMGDAKNLMNKNIKFDKLRKRPKRLKAVSNDINFSKKKNQIQKRSGQSSFTRDLTDVSRVGALRTRSNVSRFKNARKK